MKVLVIEDEQMLAMMLQVVLKKSGFEVDLAYSGNTAIKYIENNEYQFIFTDLIMDDGDGYVVLNYLKDNNLKIPTIVISANSSIDDIKQTYAYNIIDYITKPFDNDILIAKVNNLRNNLYGEELITLCDDSYSLTIDGRTIDLTAKEFELFSFLYKNPNRKYSKYDLIDSLWYENYNMSEKIVEVTVYNVRKKLGDYGHLIASYRNQGYCYEPLKN